MIRSSRQEIFCTAGSRRKRINTIFCSDVNAPFAHWNATCFAKKVFPIPGTPSIKTVRNLSSSDIENISETSFRVITGLVDIFACKISLVLAASIRAISSLFERLFLWCINTTAVKCFGCSGGHSSSLVINIVLLYIVCKC